MTDTTGPMETVRRYVDAFNKVDVQGMAVLFDESGSILDGLVPHVWHGATAWQQRAWTGTEKRWMQANGQAPRTAASPLANRRMSMSRATVATSSYPRP
ncbi:MAG: hypothetical protein ACR652_23945 [Methylocystis sp.]|uniref:hypothetical protein n=1 Tax=Methylocystis sp. TaxID=1911079 RepID=UPI003DA48CD4